uniref:Uncharacterized protein n=1 Tax=Anguilla anguilla TaxID=7936 RepID=A0A0E9WDC5_ANGAN
MSNRSQTASAVFSQAVRRRLSEIGPRPDPEPTQTLGAVIQCFSFSQMFKKVKNK